MDHDDGPPFLDRDGRESELVLVETGLAVGIGRVRQGAVQIVGPGVVTTDQTQAFRLILLGHRVAAVTADVEKAMQLPLAVACDDDGVLANLTHGHIAGIHDLVDGGEELPAPGEDGFLLEGEDLGVPVEPCRQAVVVGQPLVDLGNIDIMGLQGGHGLFLG